MMTQRNEMERLQHHEERTGREAVLIQGKGDMRPTLVEKKVELVEEFAFLFYRNMKKVLMEHKLSGTDILVLFCLLERWNMKSAMGLVGISQTGLAKELGISRQQVSRSTARLEEAGVLLKDAAGDVGINPAVILKGSPKELWKNRIELLEQGMKAIGVTSVI